VSWPQQGVRFGVNSCPVMPWGSCGSCCHPACLEGCTHVLPGLFSCLNIEGIPVSLGDVHGVRLLLCQLCCSHVMHCLLHCIILPGHWHTAAA